MSRVVLPSRRDATGAAPLVRHVAQLRLRGPLHSSLATAIRQDLSQLRARPLSGSSFTGVAVASCAVGFGMAALFIFLFFKVARGPTPEELAEQRPRRVPRPQVVALPEPPKTTPRAAMPCA